MDVLQVMDEELMLLVEVTLHSDENQMLLDQMESNFTKKSKVFFCSLNNNK